MKLIVKSTLAAALAALLTGQAVTVHAQKGGKPKPPASYPGTAVFDCNVSLIDACTDGIVGDGTSYLGFGASETGSGTHFNVSSNELWMGSGAVGYQLTLDFRGQAPSCGSACRWDWVNDQRYTATNFEIQSNVVSGPAGAEVTGGLLSIPVGSAGYSRIKVNFYGPGGDLYELRFNSLEAPGSTAVRVTRLAACSWVFTDDGALANLKSGTRRTLVNEGLFAMPFTLTVNVPGCAPGA